MMIGSAVIAFTLTLLSSSFIAVAAAAGGGKGSWTNQGAGVETWVQDPTSGLWANYPSTRLDDPDIYKFDLLCLVAQNDFDKACLVRYDCPKGKDGRPVKWFHSPKDYEPPVWQPISGTSCVYATEPRNIMADIARDIEKRFRELPVRVGTPTGQPSPHTLRGAETNFYVEASTQEFDLEMLGQKVHVKAAPIEYKWNYGDGATRGPGPFAGGPLPESRWGETTNTSHIYAKTGDYSVVVTTYFQGTYSVNGGPSLPIPGTGEFTSQPLQISVWRSVTRNYADNCIENPQGAGC